jgi:hypothetical protein
MANALKVLLKKPPLMREQQLLYIHQMWCRRWCCCSRPDFAHKQRKSRAKATQDQAKAAKKVALEAEKDNDATQKEVHEL